MSHVNLKRDIERKKLSVTPLLPVTSDARLLNSLVAAAAAASPNGSLLGAGGGGGSGGGGSNEGGGSGGGQELSHFTAFVVHHVLAHLWQRAYK